jgi:hypothetical protein
MGRYAILDSNNKIINVIIADSLDIAKQITQSEFVIEENNNENPAYIGATYSKEGKFELPDYAKELTTEQMIALRQERIKKGELKVE